MAEHEDNDGFYDPEADPPSPETREPDPDNPNPVTEGEPGAKARDAEPSNVVDHPSSKSRNGKPIDEAEEEPEQIEMFEVPVQLGKKELQLNDIIVQARRRNIPIEMQFSMTGKSIPNMSGGLLDPFATGHMLLADCVVDHVKPQFIRDGNRQVEKLVLYCVVKPVGVASIHSEQGQTWIREAQAA